MRTVAKTSRSTPSRLLRKFRATTAERIKMKTKAGVWPGFEKTPIKLLPKPGSVLPSMVALPHDPPAFSQGGDSEPRSKLRIGGSKWLGRVTTSAVAQGGQVKNPVQVSSLYDLHTPRLDSTKLLPWINAIARGQSVQATDAGKDIEGYLPALERLAKLFLPADFRRKHVNLSAAFTQVVKSTGSEWRWAESEGETGSTTIRSVEDCRRFLLRIRSLPLKAGVQASFLKQPLGPPGEAPAVSQGGPEKRRQWPSSSLKRRGSQPAASPADSQGAPERRDKWPRGRAE